MCQFGCFLVIIVAVGKGYNPLAKLSFAGRTKDSSTFAWQFYDVYLDGVVMTIINESQPEFRQKIGTYLEQCAPSPLSISLEQLTNILPINLRELAWIIAICEGQYPYVEIPWGLPSLKDRVEVLHNIFLTKITQEIRNHASGEAMASISFDAKKDAIHKLMGIQWEITHDYNGKEVPTYWILSINDTEQLKSIIVRLLSAIQAKMVTPMFEPIQMMTWIKQHNKEVRSNQIIRLLNKICVEQPIRIDPEKISEPIHSYNLAWVFVICHKGLQRIEEVKLQELELMPLAEITNEKIMDTLQKSNHPHKLKMKCFDEVDLRDSGAVKKIFSYEIPPILVLELISNDSLYKIKNNTYSNYSARPVHVTIQPITIIINNFDLKIFNTKFTLTQVPKSSSSNNDNQSSTKAIDEIIETILRADLGLLIKKTFPHYTGQIATKAPAPHRLIIKVMIMMIKLGREDITWIPIKQFIEEYISGFHERETLAKLEEINDDYLKVAGIELDKLNATKKIGDYKRDFKIKLKK